MFETAEKTTIIMSDRNREWTAPLTNFHAQRRRKTKNHDNFKIIRYTHVKLTNYTGEAADSQGKMESNSFFSSHIKDREKSG